MIRSRARLTYAQAQRILAGEEQAEPELTESLRRAERITADLRERRFARGALRIETGEVAFRFDGEGGVADAWREQEPKAHVLVEELMIRANEAVAELLAGRRREALYRVHERPDPQAISLLLAKLHDLGVPTPPAPERLTRRRRRRCRSRGQRAGDGLRDPLRPGPQRVSVARPTVAQAGALRPAEPRPLGPGQHCVLPLHLADPPLPRPRRPPRAAARARRLGRAAAGGPAGARRARLGARARGRAARVPARTRSASPGCSTGASTSSAGRRPSRARSPA